MREYGVWESGKVEVLTWQPSAGDQPCRGESGWRRQKSLRTSGERTPVCRAAIFFPAAS